MTKDKRNALFAWLLFVLILATNLGPIIYYITRPDGFYPFQVAFPLVPVLFALVGALITSRHPHNVIGLVMMLPGLSFAFLLDAIFPVTNGLIPPPEIPSVGFLILLWFSNWNWLLLILPVMFIMLLFPTGRLVSPRWKWVLYFGLWIVGVMVVLSTFSQELGPNVDPIPWTVPNPIGFISSEWIDVFLGPFLILFPIWILLCAFSLFLRFRRARGVEREQIKWLFYAGIIFVLCYLPSFFGDTFYQNDNLFNLLIPIGMSTLPIAIGVAILRYRLYDIDIIIRRTIQYAILTGLLALTYFGGVIVLQEILGSITGEFNSPLVTVITTLGIAALFNPLRIRVQDFIDRRFYRKKYNAEQALAHFAATARDEVDMEKLTTALLEVVEETVQPNKVSLWVKDITPKSQKFKFPK